MLTFTVHVTTATHDDLQRGDTATTYSRVDVLADTDTEALLVACQMAACRAMPTSATIVETIA